ncbi:hypothetical protein QJQ45_007757 [Haematococcus lacustris]|nr:hypothetical protein QJQ45_007757 [Haematococcus lacustris]
MSTANHPQTDGQTERANRTLEDMLRNFVSPHHDDWDDHDDSFSPFRLNSGQEPHTPLSLAAPTAGTATADILEVVTPVALKLQFPEVWKNIHPVVHVSHVKLHNDGSALFPTRNPAPPPDPDIIDGEAHYEVQEIRNHRFLRGALQLQGKWKGHLDHENSWLPYTQLQEDLSKGFLNKIVKAYEKRTKQPRTWMKFKS